MRIPQRRTRNPMLLPGWRVSTVYLSFGIFAPAMLAPAIFAATIIATAIIVKEDGKRAPAHPSGRATPAPGGSQRVRRNWVPEIPAGVSYVGVQLKCG